MIKAAVSEGGLIVVTQPLCMKFSLATIEDTKTVIRALLSSWFLTPPQKAWSSYGGTAPGLVWNVQAPQPHSSSSLGTLISSRGPVDSCRPSVLSLYMSPFCFPKPEKDSSFRWVHPSLSWDNKNLVHRMGVKAMEKRKSCGQKPPVNIPK